MEIEEPQTPPKKILQLFKIQDMVEFAKEIELDTVGSKTYEKLFSLYVSYKNIEDKLTQFFRKI